MAAVAAEVARAAENDHLVRRRRRGERAAERDRRGVPLGGLVEGDFGDGQDAAGDAQLGCDGAEPRGAADDGGGRALGLPHHVVVHVDCAPLAAPWTRCCDQGCVRSRSDLVHYVV